MNNKNLGFVFFAIFASLFGISSVFSVADFSVSPVSITFDKNVSEAGYGVIIINNTGNETLNLTSSKVNFVSGANSFNLTINSTSYTDFINGTQVNLGYNFTTGIDEGIFNGKIFIVSDSNSSLNKTIPITVTVVDNTPAPILNYSLITIDSSENEEDLEFALEKDDHDTIRFYLKNTGNITLTNLNIDVNEDESDMSGSDYTFQIGNHDTDNIDELKPGEISDLIEIRYESDKYISTGIYNDIEFIVKTSQNYTYKKDIKVTIEGNNEDIKISDSALYVSSGLMTMIGEPGENVDNYEFRIDNQGDTDVADISFELDGDLKGEYSSATIPANAVTFSPSHIDLYKGDNDNIEVIVNVPADALVGDYFAKIKAISSSGKEYDNIRLKVKVIGDIYVNKIEYDENVKPGDNLNVDVTINNKGSLLYRNIRIVGTLYDIDSGNGDVVESSSSFLLDVDESRTETLKFNIPNDASDGSKTLEIRVTYDDETLVEIENLNVVRNLHNLDITSFVINPSTAKCDDTLYSYIKFQNLGKYDEDVKIKAEILGTNLIQETNEFEIGVDEIAQKNLVFDISNLKAGTYEMEEKVYYGSSIQYEKKTVALNILDCNKTSYGVVVKDLNNVTTNTSNFNQTKIGPSDVYIFGFDMPRSTFYLGTGVFVVFILIIFTLFML